MSRPLAHPLVRRFERLCDTLCRSGRNDVAVVLVAALALLFKLLSTTDADPDLFARVAMGHLALSSGAVPLHDPFAFTSKHTMWIDHEWLSGVIFYWIASTFGDFGLFTLKLILPVWSLI